MQIFGSGHIHNAHAVRPSSKLESKPAPHFNVNQASGSDKLDISSEAEFVSIAKDIPDIRADRVAEIRAQIQSGAYETEEKLDIALDRLLDEIG